MAAVLKPGREGAKEKLSLDSAASHMLEECRMVLPGIQALFGFQLIAVFNQGFSEKLAGSEQVAHLVALLLSAVAAALVMTPAAIHRYSEQRHVSERFIRLCSALLVASMVPLAVGLALDIYLISRIVLGSAAASTAVAGALLVLFLALWIVVPRHESRRPH